MKLPRPCAIAAPVIAFAVIALSGIADRGHAQGQPAITPAMRTQVVDSLARTLVGRYVFPEVGNQLAADLRARLARGEYDGLNSHPTAEEQARRALWAKTRNYGFDKVERLAGNVGYVELRGFMAAAMMRQTAMAAMKFLANADAVIIDLRRNGGGDPAAVALLCSWLFPKGQKVHLNDLYWREGNRTERFYTDPKLDVPRFTGPVYVLTSNRTFSAAEEFTYNLKQLKRATQVGETTGGGANPGNGVQLSPNVGVFMPTGRAINPITKDNWEGKGNVPEIPASAEDALRTAHLKALEELASKTSDPDLKRGYEAALAELRGKTS